MINCLPNRIAESRQIFNRKEKNLYNSWLNQAFEITDLRTLDGLPLSILNPGVRNETEGPDFHNALVLIDGKFEQGDVELHLDSADWYKHNHDQDPNYNNVILHVVINVGKAIPIKTSQNRLVPTMKIAPPEPSVATYACEKWKGVSLPDLRNVLRKFAEIRFRRKAQIFRSMLMASGLEQTFYEGLADVMGYSRNRLVFSNLVKMIPIELVQRILKETSADQRIILLEGLLFGSAGFLNKTGLKKFIRDTDYTTGLGQIWLKISKEYNLSVMENPEWHFAGSRPLNFPSLRIAALAQILVKFFPNQPADSWIRVLYNAKNFLDIKAWASDKFQQPDGLWRNHPLLKQQPGRMLIGTQRFNDLLSNVLFPFGWAVGSLNNDSALITKSITLAEEVECREVPGTVQTALARLSVNPKELKSNFLVQGMIEFIRRYCNMNICNLCPLEKYAEK